MSLERVANPVKCRASTAVRARVLVRLNESYQEAAATLDPLQAVKLLLEVAAFELAQQGLSGHDFAAFARDANARARHR